MPDLSLPPPLRLPIPPGLNTTKFGPSWAWLDIGTYATSVLPVARDPELDNGFPWTGRSRASDGAGRSDAASSRHAGSRRHIPGHGRLDGVGVSPRRDEGPLRASQVCVGDEGQGEVGVEEEAGLSVGSPWRVEQLQG